VPQAAPSPSVPAAPQPSAENRQPPDTVVSHLDVRIGLHVGAGTTDIAGGDAVVMTDPSGTELGRIPAGAAWQLRVQGPQVGARGPAGQGLVEDMIVFRPEIPGRFVRVAGRDYRGEVWVFRDRTGLTFVNRLGLESYLAGVVPLEIGPRRDDEIEAVKAQAVVSRTFAVRNMGRWRAEGFDFRPTVADQVYGGVDVETPLAWRAIRETRSQVVTSGRAPIDAFFFSTCGGTTAEGTEVFRNARRSYLRSIPDHDGSGRDYCRTSPRYRWRETWSGDELAGTLRRTLPAQVGADAASLGTLRGLRVADRTGSDRVARLAVDYQSGTVPVEGPAIRRVLVRPNGGLLRSNAFALTVSGTGTTVTRVVAEGRGAGHGVGLCQWGAIGRARAGQHHIDILTSYFPGTTVEPLP
jgi:stage II sporulation protein D